MSKSENFSFADDSIASAYDNVLVPILFKPWAARLIEQYQPWEKRRVLDLATGSGIFAQLAAEHVGLDGSVVGVDINSEMLALAKKRCTNTTSEVEFIVSPAYPLNIPSSSYDLVVCQQGFQFFPDKDASAKEIYRVLNASGKVIITTWRPVDECMFFGSICNALEIIGQQEISDIMRIPFDFMPESQLKDHFISTGFKNIEIIQDKQDLIMNGGITQAIEAAYATPIRPKLLALSDKQQAEFQETLETLLKDKISDGINVGSMSSNVLSGCK